MKKCIIMMLLTACVIQVNAKPLPWPAATAEALYLPFGLQWFMETDAVKKAIAEYGPANCDERLCRWMATVEEGTAIFELTFHAATLVGCELDYTLVRDAGRPYLEKLEALKRSTSEWLVRDLRDFPPQSTVPHDAYSAETKDARIIVKWREGEHSLFISIKMTAK